MIRFFRSPAEFRRWLRAHHASTAELTVGFYKVSSGRKSLTYIEALDEALAFGWIDGVRRSRDARSYTIRFTPRSAGSSWSAVNTARFRELMKLGRVTPSGLRAFKARDAMRTAKESSARRHAVFEPQLEARLRANATAAAFFDAQPPGYRKLACFWIMSAKKEGTRLRRLAALIEISAAGRRIDPMKPLDMKLVPRGRIELPTP